MTTVLNNPANLLESIPLTDLSDVTITGTPADNELLAYDSGSGEWINQTPTEAGLDALYLLLTGGTMSGNIDMGLNDITNAGDVTVEQLFGTAGLGNNVIALTDGADGITTEGAHISVTATQNTFGWVKSIFEYGRVIVADNSVKLLTGDGFLLSGTYDFATAGATFDSPLTITSTADSNFAGHLKFLTTRGTFFLDNGGTTFGTGEDAKIYYDGTDLIIDPDLVGSGIVLIGATGNDDMKLTNLEALGLIDFPTTSSSTVGVIQQNSASFIHTFGTDNLFIGGSAGNFTLTSQNCIGIGENALKNLTSGSNNVAVGELAGDAITTSSQNFALGAGSLTNLTTGSGSNVAIGTYALYALDTGDNNIAIGRNAGVDLDTSSHSNVCIGSYTMDSTSAALCTKNVAIGKQAGGTFTGTPDRNTMIGFQAGLTVGGNDNIFIGNEAGAAYNGSDQLFIDITNTATPLIHGDFSTRVLTINGLFETTTGRIVNTTRVTTTYPILAADEEIFGDTDGGAFTVTLPAGVAGTKYRIMNTGTSGNTLTIAPNGAELLKGVNSNFTLNDAEALLIVYESTEGWN